jgi:4-amino-4-deoxy-L-arabinose transferase-like glycosyltransferase
MNAGTMKSKSSAHFLALAVLITGIILRFIYLDADPYYYEWIGYITDEGRWVRVARSLVLEGGFPEKYGLGLLHFTLSPLFQLANFLIFMLSGITLFSSRIFTAICGSAILVLFWFCMRKILTSEALFLGLVLLSFQEDLLAMSRMAVPEMVAMAFLFCIYFLLVSERSSPRSMFVSGLLVTVAVGMKATVLPFFVVASTIILLVPSTPTRSPFTPVLLEHLTRNLRS